MTFLEYRFQNFLLPTIYHSVFGLNIASISPSCELKCGKGTHYLRSTKFSSLHGSNLLSRSGKKETIKELAFTILPPLHKSLFSFLLINCYLHFRTLSPKVDNYADVKNFLISSLQIVIKQKGSDGKMFSRKKEEPRTSEKREK